MWQHEISAAPFNCDLELAVIDASGEHTLLFPCRRVVGGWIKAATERRINFHPTHWRMGDGLADEWRRSATYPYQY